MRKWIERATSQEHALGWLRGRATAQITVTGAAMSSENLTLYQANSDLVFHVDTDSPTSNEGNTGFGVLEQQP